MSAGLRVLALDAALGRCSAVVTDGDAIIAIRVADGARQASALPAMVASVLEQSGRRVDLVAVTVGPGSFTGIRSALSLARGAALGFDVSIVGVTISEAFAEALPSHGDRCLWTAIAAGRERVFLDVGDGPRAFDLGSVPQASGPVAVSGDAAVAVAAILADRNTDVLLTEHRLPSIVAVARVACKRASGLLAPLSARPLYVDPPAVRPGSHRPPPVA